ncbi:MAG: 4Fe-4S dicluster domain-containing protein [Candidatus Eisenbacteria bacterium]|nr:4Fe-4S dicluster domain-containing protein [Candidatus Eisenbacteria bacterium]
MPNAALAAIPPKEADLRAAYLEQVATFPDGYKVKNCIQCGSCTGSCPVAHAMDITPRQIVALFRAGMLEPILRSRAIWICASCYACTVRCPVGIRVTDNLYALKRVAAQKGVFPRTFPAHALSEAFVGNIRRFGRNWELWLGLRYYLEAGPRKLLSPDLQRFAITMLRRHRLATRPKAIRRVDEVRAIMKKAESLGDN